MILLQNVCKLIAAIGGMLLFSLRRHFPRHLAGGTVDRRLKGSESRLSLLCAAHNRDLILITAADEIPIESPHATGLGLFVSFS
jgi:hypothetical protein